MRLYLFAMLDEAKNIVNGLEVYEGFPFPLYKKDENLIAITGIGKVNSSFVTSYVLSKFNINEIVNIGFVGAFGSFNVGDVVIVSKALYHDVDATMFGYEKGQVPKMPKYYHSSEELVKKLPNFKKSTLLTGDYFMTKEVSYNFIADMEGAAIFQVAHRLDKKILSIKIVSDIIGGNNHLEDYKEFERIGSNNIYQLYLRLEEYLNA